MEIITRKEAKEKGLTRYFTGKPCAHGHISERYVSSNCCVACGRELSQPCHKKQLDKRNKTHKENADAAKKYGNRIITRDEAIAKGLTRYFTGKPCQKGHIAERSVTNFNCIICSNEKSKQYQKAKRVLSKDKPLREAARQAAIANGDKTYFHGIPCKHGHIAARWTKGGHCVECSREHSQREEVKAYKRKHKEDNRERYTQLNRAYKVKWKKENPNYFTMYYVKRNSKVQQATPEWVNWDDLTLLAKTRDSISRKTGVEHHLDHYYPIMGKTVCGLNVPWNLQIITADENRRKHNKMPEEFYGAGHTPPMDYAN